jgi:hypothetical protein
MMKAFLALFLTACLSSPAFAQTGSHFDPSVTRHAVSAVAAAPVSQPQQFRAAPLIKGVAIGATAGALYGLWGWWVTKDCGECGPSPAGAVTGGAFMGGLIGALIGGAIGAHPQRRPGIPLGPHVSAAPAVSHARQGGIVTIAF